MSTNGYTQYGDQTYNFGLLNLTGILTLIPGMAVTSIKRSQAPEFVANAEGPKGLSPAVVLGDDMETHEITGYLLSLTDFLANKTYTFQGRYYILMGKDEDYTNKELTKCSCKAQSWSLIIAPTS